MPNEIKRSVWEIASDWIRATDAEVSNFKQWFHIETKTPGSVDELKMTCSSGGWHTADDTEQIIDVCVIEPMKRHFLLKKNAHAVTIMYFNIECPLNVCAQ